ncbi:MAG: phosphatase PAP2 family protein [Candidatus Azobacteroides sp.]|nr:phosphatase PAP2 family protein [Candidatus Azobacteroides sp.]
MKRILIFYILWMIASVGLYAQETTMQIDSISESGKNVDTPVVCKKKYVSYLVPAVLISYGVVGKMNTPLKKLDQSTDKAVQRQMKTRIRADDYLFCLPALSVYALDWMPGIQAQHNFRDRTIILAGSYLVAEFATLSLKYTTKVERPDASNDDSFPSNHTVIAFTGAHILFREYKDHSPWIGVAGYAAASLTGTLRVINRKHWISDVVAGAGIGILSAEAGYALLPIVHRYLGIKNTDKNCAIVPLVGNGHYGAGLSYRF